MPNLLQSETLDKIFHALADPTRRAILAKLKESDGTLLELSENFDMSFQAVSKHIKVLQNANLLQKQKKGRYQVCKYHSEPLFHAMAWLSRHYDMWKDSFQNLEKLLDQQKEDASLKGE